MSGPTRRTSIDACDGLLGNREKAYKECLELRYETYASQELRDIHYSLRQKSLDLQKEDNVREYIVKARELRSLLGGRLERRLPVGLKIFDGELLVDIPPANRDQVYNVFVIEPNGPFRIQDVSPMSKAISETFLYWARHCRVFCAPSFVKRCEKRGISRGELSARCWEALQEQLPLPGVAAE